MTRERIVELVEKLLRLAESPNENEAEAAKKRASHLRKKHKIRLAEVSRIKPHDYEAPGGELGCDSYWRTRLARAIARNLHSGLRGLRGSIVFVGPQADRAAHLFRYLTATIDLATFESWKRLAGGLDGPMAAVWFTTFHAEAVRALSERLDPVTAPPAATVSVETQTNVTCDPNAPPPAQEAPPETPTAADDDPVTKADREQLLRAMRQIEALIALLSARVGPWAARHYVAELVEAASREGYQLGKRADLLNTPKLRAPRKRRLSSSRSS